MKAQVPWRSLMHVVLRSVVGVSAGLVVVAIAHRASQTLSRWALANGFVELLGDWYLPRFVAWACVAVLMGLLFGLLFRHRYLAPAVLAAITVPATYIVAFIHLYEADGLMLVRSYWFESAIVLLMLPTAAWVSSRRHVA